MHIKVTSIYLAAFYFIPLCLYYSIGQHTNFRFFSIGEEYYLFFIITFLVAIIVFFNLKKISIAKVRLINVFQPNIIWLFLSIVGLPISFYFYLNFGLTFRQSGDGLANSGAVPKLVFLLKPFFTAYVFYHLYCPEIENIQIKCTKVFILLFFFLTLSSSFEALLILVLLLNIFVKRFFYKIFIIKRQNNTLRSLFHNVKFILIGFIALSSIVFVGIANKTGFEGAIDYFSNSSVSQKLSYYLYYRTSVYNASLALHLADDAYSIKKAVTSASILKDNIIYRLGVLTGQKTDRPILTNINRYNYLYIFQTPQNKEIGASPGVFASFVIAFPLLVSPLICGCYLGVGGVLLSMIRPRDNSNDYSWVAVFITYYFLFTFLHSPINNIFAIGPEPVKFFLYLQTLLLIAKYLSKKRFN